MVEDYSGWVSATLGPSNTFFCTVDIPTRDDGRASVITVRAVDTSGNTSFDSVRVIQGYVRLIELPHYYTIEDSNGLSSVAVAMDMLDLMRPGIPGISDPGFPTHEEIYNHAYRFNMPENLKAGIPSCPDLDTRGMRAALGHFDKYDEGHGESYPGFGHDYYGYYFKPIHESNLTNYIKEIVHWISFPVLRDWYNRPPSGADPEDPAWADYFVEEPYMPAVLPAYALTEGYRRWIIANGCAASSNPFAMNPRPWWDYNYWNRDITVYGLFMTDPDIGMRGIGQDFYIVASELPYVIQPMPTYPLIGRYGYIEEIIEEYEVCESGYGGYGYGIPICWIERRIIRNPIVDQYAGKYVMVAEPPPVEADYDIELAEPAINESTWTLIDMAEYMNSEYVDDLSRHIADSAGVVNLSEDASYFSACGDLACLFEPEKTYDSSCLISWKEIIDPSLLENEDFKSAIDGSIVREFIKVHRIDTEKDYYIIPFDKYTQGRFLSYAAILVDAENGYLMQASWVKEPTRYIQLTKEEAIAKVLEKHPEYDGEYIYARLVWQPGEVTHSPFYPYWEVTIGEKRYYVVQR